MGYIPQFISPNDSRPMDEQIAERYVGGWPAFNQFFTDANMNLIYKIEDPEDWENPEEVHEPLFYYDHPITHERLCFYEHAWVAIFKPNGTFTVARID